MEKPKVVTYMLIYNIFVFIIYLCSLGCVASVFLLVPDVDSESSDIFTWVCMGAIIIPFLLLQIIFAVLLFAKGKIAYYSQIISLAIGFTSIITVIPCVFLLIEWIKEDVKEYYQIEGGWFSLK